MENITESEKKQYRLSCLLEAIKLKQHILTAKEHKNRSIVELAKELEKYITNE